MLGQAPPEDPAAVERGTREFVTNCAFCHGSSATGGEGGPDLVRSVLVMHDEKGDKIGPVILQGRVPKGMPKFPMSPAQIADISAFLRDQVQKRGNRMTYEIQNVITGDPHAGEAYFTGAGKCNSCHSPNGDLAGIANKYDAVTLQSRFLYPKTFSYPGMPKVGPAPAPTKVTVTLSSGESFSGTLKHVDDFSVSLYDSSGEYHSWLLERTPGIKVELHDPLAGHIALLQKYSDTDMHNVLAYLETLK
jgi:mono/diheme cytochrome c family protein